MRTSIRRILASAVCVTWIAVGTAPAGAAAPEPDFQYFPHQGGSPAPPDLQGPCGVVVAPSGEFYVSSYYRNSVDFFSQGPSFKGTRLANVDPLSGPCGLSPDSAGRLYVNNYHRNVVRFELTGGPFETPTVIDTETPTGVVVDPATDRVYVNARTHLNVYESSGAPAMHEGEPLRIGVGSLGNAYGLAVSAFPSPVPGRLYVPDWADNTVKVFDPAVDLDEPVQTIGGPPGGFGSLRDSAVAVDWFSGEIYVADTLTYPRYAERPKAVIEVFSHVGVYRGRLKYDVIDGEPVGLAVDNSEDPEAFEPGVPSSTQGRVYVTSGNSVQESLYGYPPNSAVLPEPTPSSAQSPPGPPAPSAAEVSSVGVASIADAGPSPQGAPGAATSVVAQRGNLRVSVEGKLRPKRLPRRGVAPIRVSVGGQIATTDGSLPPQLKTVQIELNSNGRLERRGLPRCRYERIQPGSSKRALAACRRSLVGTGSFAANIILAGQEPYPTKGRLLVFNAQGKGGPVLFGHIHTARPFATSFVIVFELRERRRGRYGTMLHARIPKAMDSWGRLTALEMTLGHNYRAAGQRRSYISAGCPAPKGFPTATFPLTRTTFAFKGGKRIASTLISECKVRG